MLPWITETCIFFQEKDSFVKVIVKNLLKAIIASSEKYQVMLGEENNGQSDLCVFF